jgi:hypothetical protein
MIDAASPQREQIFSAIRAFTCATVAEAEAATLAIIRLVNAGEPYMTGFRVFRDGSQWCAVGPEFKDLMSSPAGFGGTPAEAVAAYQKATAHEARFRNFDCPGIANFTVETTD